MTKWYHALDHLPRVHQCNTEASFTLRDLEMIKQKDKESFTNFLIRRRSKAAHMINRPTEVDQVPMIIQGLIPSYRQYLKFANILTITDLKKMGIMVEKKMAANKATMQIPTPPGNLTTSQRTQRQLVPQTKEFQMEPR